MKEAKKRLADIDKAVIESMITKQAALILLKRQAEFIEGMIHEGLLTDKDGDVFFEKFRRDEGLIRKSRRDDFK